MICKQKVIAQHVGDISQLKLGSAYVLFEYFCLHLTGDSKDLNMRWEKERRGNMQQRSPARLKYVAAEITVSVLKHLGQQYTTPITILCFPVFLPMRFLFMNNNALWQIQHEWEVKLQPKPVVYNFHLSNFRKECLSCRLMVRFKFISLLTNLCLSTSHIIFLKIPGINIALK